jgi:hypothetical protein
VRGAVLIIGVGTVGSSLARYLARLGVDLRLVDKGFLDEENIIRHEAGAQRIGQPKVAASADRIREDLPHCSIEGIFGSFTDEPDPDDPAEPMPIDEQRRLISEADVVVAATDRINIQRHINRLCYELLTTAVFPGVWIHPQTHEAESGEVLWVDPNRRMPCYECVTLFRHEAQDADAGRGTQADIDPIVLETVMVVRGLLEPESDHAKLIRPDQNLILVHGFMPPSREVGRVFNGRSVVHVHVDFPREPCPVCGQHENANRQRPTARPSAPVAATRVASATAIPMPPAVPAPPPRRSSRRSFWPIAGLIAVLAALALVGWGVVAGIGALISWVPPGGTHAVASSQSSNPGNSAQSVPWTSPASFAISYPDDMTTACVQQYGPGASAQLITTSVPSYDVVCVQDGSSVGGLDLDSFCTWLAQQDHYQSSSGWWAGNSERFDMNTSDQPWLAWQCYNSENRP